MGINTLPWEPSFTSGCHGGRQARICSLTLTSGLFSRAGEKPQQWSPDHFKSQPIRSKLRGPPALAASAKGYITCQRRGSCRQRERADLSEASAVLLGQQAHTHTIHTLLHDPDLPPNNAQGRSRALNCCESFLSDKGTYLFSSDLERSEIVSQNFEMAKAPGASVLK